MLVNFKFLFSYALVWSFKELSSLNLHKGKCFDIYLFFCISLKSVSHMTKPTNRWVGFWLRVFNCYLLMLNFYYNAIKIMFLTNRSLDSQSARPF